ncbi:MAG: AI-2E family transporter [Synechococcaceae cyanobacterium]|nr:AI-2E family transporter [Synechococcaceae cyanobacterium]
MSFGHWLGLTVLAAALFLLWSLREAMVLLFAAVVVAMAICTLVGSLRRRLGCARPLALGLSLLAIVLTAALVATVIIPPFVAQFSELLLQLPKAGRTLAELLRHGAEAVSEMVYGRSDGGLNWLRQELWSDRGTSGAITGGAQRLAGLAGNLGSGLLQSVFVLAVALMIASQPESYREVILQLVPSFYRRRARTVLQQCGDALSAWMVGVLISSLCVATLSATGLLLLHVRLVAACAVLAGLLNIIPNIGPTLSTLFPMSVALLDSPWKALAVLLLYVLVQNLESYLITPSVMHHQLRLLPGLTLSAQLIFTVLFGGLGLLLALPLAVCLQVVLREVMIHDILDPWKRRGSRPRNLLVQ